MSDGLKTLVTSFNQRLNAAETYLFITRDAAAQAAHVQDLRQLDLEAQAFKEEATSVGDERAANLMLAYQCAADSLAEELEMWLALRADNPDRAWDHLVSAQEAAEAVMRLDLDFGHVENRLLKLDVLAKIVFPPQVFMSAGVTVHGADCSVCGQDYEACDHIAGRAYWGEFAAMVPRHIEADHGAIVGAPADRRCRAIWFGDEGRRRNRMTWLTDDVAMEDRTFHGVLMSFAGRWGSMRLERAAAADAVKEMVGKPVVGGGSIEA